MVRPFAIEFGGWASKRLLRRRGHPGRIPCRAPHRLDPPRMFGSRHHLERASPPRRPVSVLSIPSHGQNASLPKQGLSSASPHKIAARLLRSRMSVVFIIATNVAPPELSRRPNRQTRFGVGAVRHLQLYCSDAVAPEPMHFAQVAAAPNVLFDQSKIVSRNLHRQTDSQTEQVFVQDWLLSGDSPANILAGADAAARSRCLGNSLS